jgi:hypothetical protein
MRVSLSLGLFLAICLPAGSAFAQTADFAGNHRDSKDRNRTS